MRHTDYRTLIDRGRKAGLGTAELYRAMNSHRPEAEGRAIGMADGNGFVSGYNRDGRCEFNPVHTPDRS
jgi:hypothetical protein